MANQGNQRGKSDRGLASADKETRERVAREGGKASGGGRKESSGGSGRESSGGEGRERAGREGGQSSGGGR